MTMNKPAILLITADELSKDALGCYGNRAVATPNLDKLAQTGLHFQNAYTVSPWCLPSRCSILTGLYPHNSGAYSNFRKCPLDTGVPNLFTSLKQVDYSTALVGKCHFAPVPYSETRPDSTLPYDEFRDYYLSLGLDHLDLQDDKQVSVWFYDDYAKELDDAGFLGAYRRDTWDHGGNRRVFPFPGPAEWHPDAWVGRKSVEYINEYQSDAPMFLWVSFSGPHYPFDAPAEYLERVNMENAVPRVYQEGEFADPSRIHHHSYYGPNGIDGCSGAENGACGTYSEEYWQTLRKAYYANVAQIDEEIGKILQTFSKKFGENTLLMFTADHGDMLGNHGLWGKNNCGYEDVWSVPLMVQYPGERSGKSVSEKVMLTDILPTCLKAAEAQSIACDGQDFKETIAQGGYDYVFAEGEGYLAVSDGTVKYIRIQQHGKTRSAEHDELIDLSRDPHEFNNLIEREEYAPKLAELRHEMVKLLMRKALP